MIINFEKVTLEEAMENIAEYETSEIFVEDNRGNFIQVNEINISYNEIIIIYDDFNSTLTFTFEDYKENILKFFLKTIDRK